MNRRTVPNSLLQRTEMGTVETTVIEIYSSSDEEDCVKSIRLNTAMKNEFKKSNKSNRWIDDDECVILDFDPYHSINKLSISDNGDEEDLSIVAERGQVACRDYPHSRHLCAKFPFNSTLHHEHCQLCYCFVCESVAPCKYWNITSSSLTIPHCHATERDPSWVDARRTRKKEPSC